MFIYLNFCPDSLNPWFLFYKELFENKSPNVIALTLNRILKGNISDETDDLKKIAKTLLNKLTGLLSLQYQYIGDMRKLRKEESTEHGLLSKGFNIHSILYSPNILCYLFRCCKNQQPPSPCSWWRWEFVSISLHTILCIWIKHVFNGSWSWAIWCSCL